MMIEQKNQTDNNVETTVDNIDQNSDLNQELNSETELLNYPSLEEPSLSLENQELSTEDNDTNVVEAEFAELKDQSLNEEISSEVVTPEIESTPTSESTSTTESKSESESQVDYAEVIRLLQNEVSKLTEQLEQEKQQHSGLKAQYARIVADFENFRRRTDKEKKEMEQQTKKKTINELLPVVDNFERARTQIKPANDGEMAIHKSYQGVYKNLVESLKKIGVTAMRPEGKPFDPNYHEAMLRESTSDYEDGIVIEQLVRGYLLNEEVLRYAMVKVAVRDVQSEESESQDQDSSVSD